MSDAAQVGERVLEGLAKGRTRAIAAARERAAPTWRAIRAALDNDILDGYSARGRASRIKRRLRLTISERQVNNVLVSLYSASDSLGFNDASSQQQANR